MPKESLLLSVCCCCCAGASRNWNGVRSGGGSGLGQSWDWGRKGGGCGGLVTELQALWREWGWDYVAGE